MVSIQGGDEKLCSSKMMHSSEQMEKGNLGCNSGSLGKWCVCAHAFIVNVLLSNCCRCLGAIWI